jgi:propanediol dehydratase large subunit
MSEAKAVGGAGQFRRFRVLDQRAVNLDGFASEDPELGLAALHSPYDPDPSLRLDAAGQIVELDGTPAEKFDIIDCFISRYGIDTTVAAEAMAISDVDVARMLVDPSASRESICRLGRGMTPGKLARIVAMLQPAELMIAIAKMRVRRTPSIQAHVTNRLDDPMLLAADAATAVALGFRELETTVPVLGDAPSNAVALLIGSQVGEPGALTQCSIEEALELDLGMRGLTTYAETVSLYGTEQVFIDGDDTPWSKAFLCSAYASRGLKMRVTSGAGAEVLMGEAERRSMLYLESRCVALARAAGAQGVQNGGIDGASVAASVPGGMRELLAENLLVMLHGLESCSGNDTLVSESDLRRAAHTVPLVLAGSDFIFSGFGSVPSYDNMFGPSNFNAEDLDDYLVIQRDWAVDGGLRPVPEAELLRLRDRAARAVQAVYRELGLADFSDDRLRAVVTANGSQDLPDADPLVVPGAAAAILQRGITGIDVATSLARTGFTDEAERVLGMLKERVKGDYLQPAAIFDAQMRVLSKVTDPNDYRGPGTGYVPDRERLDQIASVRQQRSVASLMDEQSRAAGHVLLEELGPADVGQDLREVAIGVSPAFARDLWIALSGLSVGEVLRQIVAGIEEEGAVSRIVRVPSTIDLGMIGLSAARLAGSGIGVGLQAKGTALIHRRDLAPLANLELLSMAPLITPEMYRSLGRNAARHAKGVTPAPIRNAYTSQAITARYHARTVAMVAVERRCSRPGSIALDVCVKWDPSGTDE